MEGVGARLGRSSTRYSGPATVFTGPVRKWKKKWVPVPPNNNNGNNSTHSAAGANNNNNSSHLLLYKWTPLTPVSNSAAAANGNGNNPSTPAGAAVGKDSTPSDAPAAEEPPPRKFRYMPIAVPEEPKQEMEEDADDESTPNNADLTEDEKPDVNEVSVEDAEALDKEQGKEANGTHLDLNLGLKSHDGKRDDDADEGDDDVQMKSPTITDSGNGNRGKRKAPDLN